MPRRTVHWGRNSGQSSSNLVAVDTVAAKIRTTTLDATSRDNFFDHLGNEKIKDLRDKRRKGAYPV